MLLETEVGEFYQDQNGGYLYFHGRIYPRLFTNIDKAKSVRLRGPDVPLIRVQGKTYYYVGEGGSRHFNGSDMVENGPWKHFSGWEIKNVVIDKVRYKAHLEEDEIFFDSRLCPCSDNNHRLRIEKCS